MTHTEFASWLQGMNAALGGNPPSAELWQRVIDEASKLAPAYVPPPQLAPYFPPNVRGIEKWLEAPQPRPLPLEVWCDASQRGVENAR